MPRERGGGGLAVSGQPVFCFAFEAWLQAGYALPSGGLYKALLVDTLMAPLPRRFVGYADHGRDLPERCPALAHDSRLWTFEALTVFSSENCPNNQK